MHTSNNPSYGIPQFVFLASLYLMGVVAFAAAILTYPPAAFMPTGLVLLNSAIAALTPLLMFWAPGFNAAPSGITMRFAEYPDIGFKLAWLVIVGTASIYGASLASTLLILMQLTIPPAVVMAGALSAMASAQLLQRLFVAAPQAGQGA